MKTKLPVIMIISLCMMAIILLASCSTEDGSPSTDSSIGREYAVSLEGKARVIIPPNALPAETKVSLKEISELRDYYFGGFLPVGLFDISASTGGQFAGNVTLEFTYDKASLDSTLEDLLQLAVAYYDDSYDRWQEVDFEVDDTNSKVIVETNHLSLWSLFVKDEKYVTLTAPYFTIYFSKDAKAPAIGTITSGDPIYEYATIVRTGLYDAYQACQDLGLKMPEHTRVYIDDWGADKEAEWGWFSKNIEIPVTYIYEKELRLVVAHELFHAVQNQYVDFVAMDRDRWWIEATADYAAAHIATSYGLKEKLGSTYLARGVTDKETFHTYQTAHFIKYLVDSGLDFKPMFDYVMTQPGSVLANLTNYCLSQGKPLPALYDSFAYSVLFENSVDTANAGMDIYNDLASQKVEMDLDITGAKTIQMNVGANYASSLSAVKIVSASYDEVEIPIRAIESASGVKVQYILAKGPSRADVLQKGILDHNPIEVKVKDGYYLYFLSTNMAPGSGDVTVVIGEESDGQPYANSRTASLYNDTFLADVEFNLFANQAFTIYQEAVDRDMLVLRLVFNKSEKDIIIDVEGIVSNLRFSSPDEWGEEWEPVFKEMYWATSEGSVYDTKTQIILPQDDPRGMTSFGYELVIDLHNTVEDTYSWGGGSGNPGGGGGAAVILVGARILN